MIANATTGEQLREEMKFLGIDLDEVERICGIEVGEVSIMGGWQDDSLDTNRPCPDPELLGKWAVWGGKSVHTVRWDGYRWMVNDLRVNEVKILPDDEKIEDGIDEYVPSIVVKKERYEQCNSLLWRSLCEEKCR